MKAGVVQRIFSDHFGQVERSHGLDGRSRRAAWCILTCRTGAHGYHVDACPNGDYAVRVNNSCKHRSCPQCGAVETELWLERQCAKGIGCAHHQIVFTSPADLRVLWRWNRALFTNLYFRAAWHTLRELLGDKRWLGALPGALIVFQSWGDELQEHLHLHVVLTSGGIGPEGKWHAAQGAFLLPTGVLAAKFRGKFLAYLREGFEPRTATGLAKPAGKVLQPPPQMGLQRCLNLLNKLGRQRWHVQIEPAYAHARGLLKYTGRYIRRGPISERRILSYDGTRVRIGYAHPDKHTAGSFVLDATEFVRRLLLHVPARGSHCVRVYGLYHSSQRALLNRARAAHAQPPYETEAEPPDTHELLHRMFPDFTGDLCPHCHLRLQTVEVVHPAHAPPMRAAA